MDLMRIRSDNFQPEDRPLIQEYESLVWTERYSTPGEFVLTSADIEQTQADLPVDGLLAIRESPEVMIIDSHEISAKEDGGNILTVRGRTFDSFLEHRVAYLRESLGYYFRRSYTPTEVVAAYIWDAVVNNSSTQTIEIIGPNGQGQYWGVDNPGPLNKIPNVIVSESAPAAQPSLRWKYEEGYVLNVVTDILQGENLGLRMIRPNSSGGVQVDFTLAAGNAATSGLPVKASLAGGTGALRFDVYFGVDRSGSVEFNIDNDELDDLSFFQSSVGNKNVVLLRGKRWPSEAAGFNLWHDPLAASGLNRRVVMIDAEPVTNDNDTGYNLADAIVAVTPQAQFEATQHPLTYLFDGEVQESAQFNYKQHYDLGDLVTIRGPYGLSGVMRVAEYVRSEDEYGERAFPTLSQV